MSIFETYKQEIQLTPSEDCDYILYKVNENTFVGYDKENNLTVTLRSNNPKEDSFSQRTNLISLETNKFLIYQSNKKKREDHFHILKMYSSVKNEKDIFTKLCDTYFSDYHSSQDIITVFMILSDFFSKRKSYNKEELQGLYAELYTIYHFKNQCDFSKYWQSKDNLKFDFSITSKLKLEIKSTLKTERIHRFQHEQLARRIFDIYVLSYKLRYDDQGLGLKELIYNCLPILANYPEKVGRLYKILFECSENELESQTYSEEYTIDNMKLFDARDIPHFEDAEGVSDAAYNSDMEGINNISFEELLTIIEGSIVNC